MQNLLEFFLNIEKELLKKDVRSSEEKLRYYLHKDFIEIGRSGHVFDLDSIIHTLSLEEDADMFDSTEISSPMLQKINESTWLLTTLYVSSLDDSTVRRSSIYKHNGEYWQMIFHQGTYVRPET